MVVRASPRVDHRRGGVVAHAAAAGRAVLEAAPLGALPPTGRTVEIDGLIFDHLVDGRVAERWEQSDQSGLLRQLGVA